MVNDEEYYDEEDESDVADDEDIGCDIPGSGSSAGSSDHNDENHGNVQKPEPVSQDTRIAR